MYLGQLAGSSATRPSRRARSSRFLTDEADHFALPRGVRSCRRSSWPAMSRSDRSGLDCEIPATRVIRRSSGSCGDARFSRVGSARCSVTSHLTARRSRSGVQSRPRCFRTRAISSQLWSGRIRRTVGSHWFIVDCMPSAIGCLLHRGHLRQGFGPALPDTRIAWQPALRSCSDDAGLGPLRNQRTLELGDGAEYLQRKHALRRRRVDRISQRSEMRALLSQILDHLEEDG